MSFSVSIKNSNIEYSGSGLGGLFANKSNLFNFKFLMMIKEIISFYKIAPEMLNDKIKEQTLGDFLKEKKLSKYFIEYHLIPMVAAIWSMPFDKAKEIELMTARPLDRKPYSGLIGVDFNSLYKG